MLSNAVQPANLVPVADTATTARLEGVLARLRSLPQSEVKGNVTSWYRHLRAGNLSTNTQQTYLEAMRQFITYLVAQGMPQTMAGIRREHAEAFVTALLESRSTSTAHNRYRAMRTFFRWCVEEGEVKDSPMARTKPPRLELKSIPVLGMADLDKLRKACEGTDFYARRDMAILHLFLSTGARKSEVAMLRWSSNDPEACDVDLDRSMASIRGKGNRWRVVDLTPATVKSLDRYLKARAGHRDAGLPALWLGKRGPLSPSGVARAIEARAREAGLGKVHVHQLRHSYVHFWLGAGGSETDLARHVGWTSTAMAQRYAASAGEERARSMNRRVGLGARF